MEQKVCGKETQVFSRISGYYRPVKNWNDGKAQEFKERKVYDQNKAIHGETLGGVNHPSVEPETPIVQNDEGTLDVDLDGLILFTTNSCPHCKSVKEYLKANNITVKMMNAEDCMDLIKSLGFYTAPTLADFDNGTLKNSFAGEPAIRAYLAALPKEEEEPACASCHF